MSYEKSMLTLFLHFLFEIQLKEQCQLIQPIAFVAISFHWLKASFLKTLNPDSLAPRCFSIEKDQETSHHSRFSVYISISEVLRSSVIGKPVSLLKHFPNLFHLVPTLPQRHLLTSLEHTLNTADLENQPLIHNVPLVRESVLDNRMEERLTEKTDRSFVLDSTKCRLIMSLTVQNPQCSMLTLDAVRN